MECIYEMETDCWRRLARGPWGRGRVGGVHLSRRSSGVLRGASVMADNESPRIKPFPVEPVSPVSPVSPPVIPREPIVDYKTALWRLVSQFEFDKTPVTLTQPLPFAARLVADIYWVSDARLKRDIIQLRSELR